MVPGTLTACYLLLTMFRGRLRQNDVCCPNGATVPADHRCGRAGRVREDKRHHYLETPARFEQRPLRLLFSSFSFLLSPFFFSDVHGVYSIAASFLHKQFRFKTCCARLFTLSKRPFSQRRKSQKFGLGLVRGFSSIGRVCALQKNFLWKFLWKIGQKCTRYGDRSPESPKLFFFFFFPSYPLFLPLSVTLYLSNSNSPSL
jgi:hypothetical protein